MVSKTANAPKIDVTWLEGGGYEPADIVGSLGDPNQGPVWVGFHGFGWIITNVDPASIPDETPIDHVVATTWGEAKAQEDLAEGIADMKQYPSIQDFAADDQTIRWMCSYEEEEREPITESLREHGFNKAADRVDAVEF